METQQLFSRKISPDSINLLTKTTEKKKAPRTEQLRVASVSFFHSLLSHGSWIHQSCFPCGLLYAFRASGDKQMLIHAPAPHNTSPAYGCCCCCCYCNRLQTHLHCSALLRSWNYFFFLRFSLTAARAKDKPSFQWHQYCVWQETKGNRTLGNTFCSQTFKLN